MKKIVLALIILLSFLSCEEPYALEECSCTTKIPITIDWSSSEISPQNVSMLFYNDSDGSLALEHYYEHNTNDVHSYAHLPVGEYTVVVFNELRNQIKNITIQGHENLSTLGFYAVSNQNVLMRSKEHSYIHQPGMLGVKVIRNIAITDELITHTHAEESTRLSDNTNPTSKMLLNIIPENKINWLDIMISIKGLNNARMPALIDLQNISEGYMVNEDKNCMTPAILQFDINNRTYNPESTKDGTISTRVALFGTLGDRNSIADHPESPIMLDILFMLVDKDKTIINHKIDITDLISFDKEVSGSVSLDIDIEIDTPLPDVEPESDDNSGFESEVKDWHEVSVPLS